MSYCVLLFVVSLSTLVLGDAKHKYIVSDLKVENTPCDTFGEWKGRYEDNKGATTKLFFDFSMKKDIGEGTPLKMKIEMPGHEAIEKEMDLLDALDDKNFGDSFAASVKPEGLKSGPPIPKNTYSSAKWVPSMNAVPSGTEGELRVTATIADCVKIVCVGTIRY